MPEVVKRGKLYPSTTAPKGVCLPSDSHPCACSILSGVGTERNPSLCEVDHSAWCSTGSVWIWGSNEGNGCACAGAVLTCLSLCCNTASCSAMSTAGVACYGSQQVASSLLLASALQPPTPACTMPCRPVLPLLRMHEWLQI